MTAANRPASVPDALAPLAAIPPEPWRALAQLAVEPNGYYLADWELAVNASARGRTDVAALSAWMSDAGTPRLIGLLPVITARRAYRLPLPALVSADPYGTLSTPLLDRDMAPDAVTRLMEQARKAGAHALILENVSLDGAAMQAIRQSLAMQDLAPRILQSHARACLDATRDADDLLRDALGAKKLKELRRQRNRLAEHGDVTFHIARTPAEIAATIDTFLTLEASGWKGKRGTALMQDAGDSAFIRSATRALAERGQCEIVTLRAGDTPVASGVLLRHLDRAFYFKLGVDERFAKLSPGVQLTLDVTRHLCADPAIACADSTANAGHPMIDPIWRGRLAIGNVLIPLRKHDPLVSLIHGALTLRRTIREPLRRVARSIRNRLR
ncbi:GNAT family N-acetyltransferase [Tardiphaga sp. P9-11]|jgi:CelD/BcsL family acetyltransferase involved in cellulose biosynthesis|uniref:GNAT family N-acetyltransferase n=1 Tax=Tardiphaga sp. P9-11 TaxID=2024614 RepID=UPI0011F357B9|nr:GNAT family N-acetyltransferase [Tardiphaga sp. P9-11]KAA0076677.1 GNAT family N-acetyltransferase [Tardiphaga sp. P9-11]